MKFPLLCRKQTIKFRLRTGSSRSKQFTCWIHKLPNRALHIASTNCTRKWINEIVNVSPTVQCCYSKQKHSSSTDSWRGNSVNNARYRIRLKAVNKETILFSNYSRHKEHSWKTLSLGHIQRVEYHHQDLIELLLVWILWTELWIPRLSKFETAME